MTGPDFLTTTTAAITRQLAVACPGVDHPGLLAALSGGPDSTALLLAARTWSERTGGALAAAHLHHGLRGGAADADAAFCADLCARLDVPLHTDRIDPRPAARERGGGLEEACRHLRRRFLQRILEQDPALHAVATGHHRDDQTETVLMRLARGTGPEGLVGIRPVDGRFIHPLLEVRRRDVIAFLQASNQPWREDVSNTEGDNLRARLRRELLPVLRGMFGPAADEAPARLAELLADDLELLEGPTREAEQAVRDGEALDVGALLALEPALARRVLRRWLREPDNGAPPGLARVHLQGVLEWLTDGTSGSGVDLPGGLRLVRSFDRLERAEAGGGPLRQAGDYRILVRPATAQENGAAPGHGEPDDEATWRLVCPASALRGNLRVRNRREGDRLELLGLDGTKKLNDLLQERRVPRAARDGVLVVEDETGILWVVGLARAERTRLLPDSGANVTVSVIRR